MDTETARETAPGTEAPFGSVVAGVMATSKYSTGVFAVPELHPTTSLVLHPAAHVLHYGSACFEGLKAHRGEDGVVRVFRLGEHVERMRRSAEAVCLPVPSADLLHAMVADVVAANRDEVPPAPGALYLRPTLIGTEANLGAAARASEEALLFVIASPVGDYFAGGVRGLTLLVETALPRTTPQFGQVKSGANYVMALGPTRRAVTEHGADQVLFAPGGDVQETGASNFLLLDDRRVVTKALDGSFLHGVTRGAVLELARDLGYEVEERDITVEELLAWAPCGEAALTGTAAGLSGVATLVHEGRRIPVGSGAPGPNTLRLREALTAVQCGSAPDRWGWTLPV